MDWLLRWRVPGRRLFGNQWALYVRQGGCKQLISLVDVLAEYFNQDEDLEYWEICMGQVATAGMAAINEHVAKCDRCSSDSNVQQIIAKSSIGESARFRYVSM